MAGRMVLIVFKENKPANTFGRKTRFLSNHSMVLRSMTASYSRCQKNGNNQYLIKFFLNNIYNTFDIFFVVSLITH